jgi:hypothetical protein
MRAHLAWITAAAVVAAAVTVVIGRFWNALGAADISPVGWLAMGFGVVVTTALGIGLMALMFFSSRHGYDDAQGEDLERTTPAADASSVDPDGGRGERHRHEP